LRRQQYHREGDKRINGGDKGIAERKIATKKAKEVIDDQI